MASRPFSCCFLDLMICLIRLQWLGLRKRVGRVFSDPLVTGTPEVLRTKNGWNSGAWWLVCCYVWVDVWLISHLAISLRTKGRMKTYEDHPPQKKWWEPYHRQGMLQSFRYRGLPTMVPDILVCLKLFRYNRRRNDFVSISHWCTWYIGHLVTGISRDVRLSQITWPSCSPDLLLLAPFPPSSPEILGQNPICTHHILGKRRPL